MVMDYIDYVYLWSRYIEHFQFVHGVRWGMVQNQSFHREDSHGNHLINGISMQQGALILWSIFCPGCAGKVLWGSTLLV